MSSRITRAGAWPRALGLVFSLLIAGVLLSYGITKEVPLGSLSGRVTMSENQTAKPDVKQFHFLLEHGNYFVTSGSLLMDCTVSFALRCV